MSHAEAGPSRARSHTRTASHSRPHDHVARYKDRPQLGHLASWSVSSHKYGYGVDNLRDGNDATYWQSEGPQPHLIDLSFPKRVLISAISILTSHRGDDSYTPSKISVQCGTTVHDLQEIRLCDFHQPDGWQHIAARPEDSSDQEIEGPPISAFHLRIIILANHLNGKDTHLRGLKVFGVPAGSILLLGGGGAGAGAAAGPSGVGFGGAAAGGEEDEEDDDEDDDEDVDSDGEGAAAPSYSHGHHRPAYGLPSASSHMTPRAQGDDARTSTAEALARREQRKREKAMKRLLKQGGADRVGYTSRAFKMHECIR